MNPPSNAHDLRMLKAQLRREALARRNALSLAERMTLADRMARRLLEHPRVRAASTVLLYLTFRSEVPTEPLIIAFAEAGKRLAVPHMTTGIRALVAAEYIPGDPLETGPYGVSQPVSLRPIPSAELDLVIVPGAAFDGYGGRMGYGKGYYDRFLADPELNAWTVGMAFEFQKVERLPTEPHDRPMDALVTEDGLVSFQEE